MSFFADTWPSDKLTKCTFTIDKTSVKHKIYRTSISPFTIRFNSQQKVKSLCYTTSSISQHPPEN